jgi:hypothetical protein
VTPLVCKCSHAKVMHYTDRKGRPTCGSTACGCIRYRPKLPPAAWPSDAEQAVIGRFDAAEPAPESWSEP